MFKPQNPSELVLFLVYFLLNFSLSATLYAGLGAMVKRQDEVQSAVQVSAMLIVSGWILVCLGAASPNATWTRVLSYVPFFTSELMLVRIGLGAVAWWEIVREGEMPPWQYKLMHSSARLSVEEKDALINGLTATLGQP